MQIAEGAVARGIVRRYNGTPALAGVDIDAAAGTLTAITGANGAGKTTMLRIFATLLKADEGDAWVNGHHVVNDQHEVRTSLGVALVNDRGVYWRLSAIKNLRFFARALGLTKKEAAADTERVIAELGMESFAGRPVMGYSAGQRQRLVLARASLAHPDCLLVDEPMRGLDEDGIARTRAMLKAHADRGATVIVAGPTISEFADLCSTVYVLQQGKVIDHLTGPRVLEAAVAGADR